MATVDVPTFRLVYINDPPKNETSRFLHNSISTAKYSVLTFVPKFLYEQFSKYANVFFLFTVIQFPEISPTNRYATLIPLSIVIFATAVKEVLEDLKRHRSDSVTNASKVRSLFGTTFAEKTWAEIIVGDIVRIEQDEAFPADLVIVSSSEPDGLCYIETANLDGETNLKIRQAKSETSMICTPIEASKLEASIKSELPNNSLYTFEGTWRTDSREIPLSPEQILLRGAVLRNTPWVYGVVIFTGHETKLMKNAHAMPVKRSNIERMTNMQIVFLFGILVALSIFSAFGNAICTNAIKSTHEYLLLGDANAWGDVPLKFLTFMILYNNLIPISLIVTMEVVKFQQSSLINSDLDMYHAETDTPAQARTSTLVEELGQVEYVFSDKTGTLTCNRMEFKQCIIGGRSYVESLPEGIPKASPTTINEETGYELGHYTFKEVSQNMRGGHSTAADIREFLTMMAVCHTVIPDVHKDTGEIIYQASSPDEAAIVNGAALLNFKFTVRRPKSVSIDADGETLDYEILNVLEFNSTRKRMSVIARTPDGRIKLYCKGADTVILQRLGRNNPHVDRTMQLLEECATDGLRTLCFGVREISPAEYMEWSKDFDRAVTTVNNRQDEIDKCSECIEKDLYLLGATAIEDKLQDGVPDTIHILSQAGIKVWVLTGDRQETAINIGYSCRLLTEEMILIILNETTHFETKQMIESKLRALKSAQTTSYSGSEDNYALIIDGRTLDFALEKDVQLTFLELAQKCKSVICCRVSPLQKAPALVVKLVKKNTKSITLAIGDGANDVSMIQAAHVGVGISGLEGLQAARSADYAIGQFRFLRKLLLVHGAWSYQRLSKLILYSFYKNITLYMTQFWFAIYNLFSGQTLYESWIISFYNVLFTVMPPLMIGVFDQHASAKHLHNYPQLYRLGPQKQFFNAQKFWGSAFNAIVHSAILFYFVSIVAEGDIVLSDGLVGGQWFLGMIVYTAVLVTVLLKAALITSYWTKYAFYSFFGSLGIWFVFIPIFTNVGPMIGTAKDLVGISGQLFSSAVFWLSIIVFPLICISRDYLWKYYQRQYTPSTYHIIQELQKYDIPDYRPRMDRFKKAMQKVRLIQRIKRNRGFAFSQGDSGQAQLIRKYDTTKEKPTGL